jgi:hypothetical protein
MLIRSISLFQFYDLHGSSFGGLLSDDAGIHEDEDQIEFGDTSKFSGFGFANGLGFVFFEEGFEPGLEVFGEFEKVETAYLLDLDAGVDPGRGLNHCLGDHCGDLDESDVIVF